MIPEQKEPFTEKKTDECAAAALPAAAAKEEILDALRRCRVAVVAGETGCGKTTQIPKFCMELAPHGIVCCTQPRRVAAITVAEKVERELGGRGLVGWQHRFKSSIRPANRIHFVTDGILLARIRHDPKLLKYSVIMVDEAHERTLNIDFLLGHLKGLLAVRPDLKVVISSATLETGRFSAFFGSAPVIRICGRTFPVEVRYAPPQEENSEDIPETAAAAVDSAIAENLPGDMLVFMPGERDIRQTCEKLRLRNYEHTEVIPLMANLPPGEQRRAFRTIAGTRRIIVSTNVAETSVTIPGIKVVIDSGLARISRYNHRAHTKKLLVEPISKASANQRAGRCGRIAPGICIRLYSMEDFESRPEFTDPEIRRSSLAGTILSMMEWGLDDIEKFPFIEPPSRTAVREGRLELVRLNAIRENPGGASAFTLTAAGREMARLPIEPRLSKILLEGRASNVAQDALTIVSFLSCDNPLVRPAELSEEASAAHSKFKSDVSDFSGILILWRFFHPDAPLSNTALRKLCKKNFVSYRRLAEWEDVRKQLSDALPEAAARPPDPEETGRKNPRGKRRAKQQLFSSPAESALHMAILSGMLANIGKWNPERKEYIDQNGRPFVIFPGSGLAKKHPDWIMAAEIVETSKPFARNAAGVNPEDIESAAAHICKHHFTSFYWDAATGTARGIRHTTLGTLTLSVNEQCDISRIFPEKSRDMFIAHGLAGGEFPPPVPDILKQSLSNAAKARAASAHDRSADESEITSQCVRFFDSVIPDTCVNAAAFRRWAASLKHEEKENAVFRPETLRSGMSLSEDNFPHSISFAGVRFRLRYKNHRGSPDDGITAITTPENIPAAKLMRPEWLVPGFLQMKIRSVIASAPGDLIAQAASRMPGGNLRDRTDRLAEICFETLGDCDRSLPSAISAAIYRASGVFVHPAYLDPHDMPEHMRIRWIIADANGRHLFQSRNFAEIMDFYTELNKLTPLDPFSAQSLGGAGPAPECIAAGKNGSKIIYTFAFKWEGSVKCFTDMTSARAAESALKLEKVKSSCPELLKFSRHGNSRSSVKSLSELSLGSADRSRRTDGIPAGSELFSESDALDAAILGQLPAYGGSLSGRLAHRELAQIMDSASEIYALAEEIVRLRNDCTDMIETIEDDVSAGDMISQLNWLVFPGFVRHTAPAFMAEIPRYIEGAMIRVTSSAQKPELEKRKMFTFGDSWERYVSMYSFPGYFPEYDPDALCRYRRAVEETRLAIWAPKLAQPGFSRKRLDDMWNDVVSS